MIDSELHKLVVQLGKVVSWMMKFDRIDPVGHKASLVTDTMQSQFLTLGLIMSAVTSQKSKNAADSPISAMPDNYGGFADSAEVQQDFCEREH